jgi:hypothetical protein
MAILLLVESVLGLKVFQAMYRDGFREAGFREVGKPARPCVERKATERPKALDPRYTLYIYKSYIL